MVIFTDLLLWDHKNSSTVREIWVYLTSTIIRYMCIYIYIIDMVDFPLEMLTISVCHLIEVIYRKFLTIFCPILLGHQVIHHDSVH
jgi:hypothetical protein